MEQGMTEAAELRHTIRRLSKVLENPVSEAMTIEVSGWLATAQARLAEIEPGTDVFEVTERARQDFKPSLEAMLFLGGDKALKTWVDGLSPMQMGALLVMGPRLVELVREKYATLESMQGPGDQIQCRKFTDRGPLLNNRKPGTEFLNDTEPGSFDD